MMKYKINVEGMSCGHCQKAVNKMLLEIEGVSNVEVSLEDAHASFETNETDITSIIETINKSDFKASL